MTDEYWATFSIFDHRRAALVRNSLLLFDRLVIPVPTEAVGDLQAPEIEHLEKEVAYLVSQEAAVRFDWDPGEFMEWQKETVEHEAVDGEALAKVLVRDPPYATRLQLSKKYNKLVPNLLPDGVQSVTALPVYGNRERYEAVTNALYTAERDTLEIVFKQIPMPARESSLEDILSLRRTPGFQDSLRRLRRWQTGTVSDLLTQGNNPRLLRAAADELERWVVEYRQALNEARLRKVETSLTSVLALGATLAAGAEPLIAALAAFIPALFSFRKLLKPCWKEVARLECAPAGVIYAAAQL